MKADPRRLLDLLLVARHGSFSGAAAATRISQPALSKSIALLEREVGVRVLERDRQGARLNAYGEALVRHAEALESLLEQAKDEIQLRSMGIEGPLAIGITPVTAVGLVPAALQQLTRETPNVAVTVTEGLDAHIMSMLRARELDLVVSRLGVGPAFPDICEDPLIYADWSLITRPEHPMAGRSAVALAELAEVQWVLPAGGSAFRQQMEVVFTTAAVRWPSRGISTNSILAIKAIVMTTDCVTIMSPRLVDVECAAGRLCSVPLTDVAIRRPVGLIWRKGEEMSPIAARFAKVLRAVAAEDPARIAEPA